MVILSLVRLRCDGWPPLESARARDLRALISYELGGEPVTSALYWQVARTPSALLEGLTESVLATARRELVQA